MTHGLSDISYGYTVTCNPATNFSITVNVLQMRKMRLKGMTQQKHLIRNVSIHQEGKLEV